MGYKIAVATSDGVHINEHFGSTESFAVFEVNDDGSYIKTEVRKIEEDTKNKCKVEPGAFGGCGGHRKTKKIILIMDCRCVLCARCGMGSQRELSKAGITTFVIEKEIDEAMKKIIQYYQNNASHVTLINQIKS